MHRRAFLQTLAATPALSLAAAEPELRIAVNQTTIESAPLLVQPIPGVQIVLVPNGRAASAQLVAGIVDAATGSETQALLNSIAQPGLRIVLTLAECRYRIVARRSAAIRQLSDLGGKRVAVTANTSSHYFLAEMLATARLKEPDVTLVHLEGHDMPTAISKHEIDAIAMWEPHAQNAINTLGSDALVLETPNDAQAYRERFNLNTTLAVLNNPTKCRQLVALMKAITPLSAQLQTSPQTHLPALSKAIATPAAVITQAWPQFRFPATLDQRPLLALLEKIEPWGATIASREPRPKPALAPLIDASVLAEGKK